MNYGYDDATPEDHYDAILTHLDSLHDKLKDEAQSNLNLADRLQDQVDSILEDALVTSVALADQKNITNVAYSQRAIAAVALAHTVLHYGGTAGVGQDDREEQPDEWRVVLYVDTHAGQLSWHISPSDQHMLEGLPKYLRAWDGTYNSSNTAFYKGFINASSK